MELELEYKEYTGENLFEDVFSFKEDKNVKDISIFQLIILFCDHHDYHVEEIGDMLRTNKSFREMIKADLKLNHEAVFKEDGKISHLNDWV